MIIPFPLKHHSIRGAIQLGLRERNSQANHVNARCINSSAVDFEVVHANGRPILLRDLEEIGTSPGLIQDWVLTQLPKFLTSDSWKRLYQGGCYVTEARCVIDRCATPASVTMLVGVADTKLAHLLCLGETQQVVTA